MCTNTRDTDTRTENEISFAIVSAHYIFQDLITNVNIFCSILLYCHLFLSVSFYFLSFNNALISFTSR